MDKNTLSKYGWIVILTLVLTVMLAFATPFGTFIGQSVLRVANGYIQTSDKVMSEENIQKNEDMWNEDIFVLQGGTNYTMEEIEADDHLYAIGATKPEYVVAKFNDDYSEVVITKNTIESDGMMMNWEAWFDYSPMQQHKNTLTKAIIKDGVVNIGQSSGGRGAFDGCENLTTISFPDSLTTIGQSAFRQCKNLKNIELPKNLKLLINGAFSHCYSLINITIPTGVEVIDNDMFNHCINLKTIVLPNTITTIGYDVFSNCTNLKDIKLPSNIVTIDTSAFCNIADNAIIYCETQEVADLLEKDVHYNGTTQVIVDASKF